MDPASSLLKMASALLLVLGLIGLAAYGARRFRSRLGRWRDEPLVHVLSTVYLSPKSAVSLIEVRGAHLVVGVTPQQISLLTRLDAAPVPAGVPDPTEEATG